MNARHAVTLVLLVALAGCARLNLERFDPRLVADVSGRVVDARSGAPLVARLHYEDDSDAIVVSSADGRFRFPQVRRTLAEAAGIDPRWARWLVAEAAGHASARVKVEPDAKGELLIRLAPAP